MKKRICLLVLFLFVFLSTDFVIASEEGQTYHVFSGTQLEIPTAVNDLPCKKVVSSLMQLSHSLGQLIEDEIETECGEDVSLTLPEVKRTTTLRLDSVVHDDTGQTDLDAAMITVYPDDQLENLKLWAMMNILYVMDREGKLIEALDNYDIGYQPRHMSLSGDKSVQLMAGSGKILFKEETQLLPMIRVAPHTVTVEMPFLEGLSADPAKQKVLADLFSNLKKTKEK